MAEPAPTLPAGAEADVVPLVPRPRRTAPRLLQAAASVAVLGIVGVGIATVGSGTGAMQDSGTTAASEAGGSAEEDARMSLPGGAAYGQDYRQDTLAQQGAALADAAGGAAARSAPDPLALPAAGTAQEAPAGDAATATSGDAAAESASSAADPFGPLRDPATRSGCLTALTGRADPPVAALDYATYEGRPALIVVVRAARTEVYAAGPGCRAGADELLGYASTD